MSNLHYVIINLSHSFRLHCNFLFLELLNTEPLEEQKRWINSLRLFVTSCRCPRSCSMPRTKTNLVRSRWFRLACEQRRMLVGNSKLFRCTLWANKMPIQQCWVILQTVLPIQSKEIGNKKYHEESKDTLKMAKWDFVWISRLDSVGREGRLMAEWSECNKNKRCVRKIPTEC